MKKQPYQESNELDSKVDGIHGSELVAELRRRGLEIPFIRVPVADRDGAIGWRRIYSFTQKDRDLIHAWLMQNRVTL